MNKVLLLGTLGKEPELKYSQSNVAICRFSIATNKNIRKKNQWEKKTEWHNIVTFSKVAVNCNKYLRKGSKVLIEGEIRTRSYESKEGETKYITEIIGNVVTFLDPVDEKQSQSSTFDFEQNDFDFEQNDDDLPF